MHATRLFDVCYFIAICQKGSFTISSENGDFQDDIIEMPIDGTLDLHTFNPKDVKELVPAYLDACLERGITEVNIIHGKGKGVLRDIIRAVLDQHPRVDSYTYGNSWGATYVTLKKD